MANMPAQDEVQLANKRLARREAAYEKLCVTIERWQRKLDKADRMVQKAIRTIAKLDRQRRRSQKAIEALKAAIADELVETAKHKPLTREDEIALCEGRAPKDDGLDPPAFLDRNKKLQALPDPRTKEKKAERRAVEKEKREAELTGKRRKMPKQGKAALEEIRQNG